MKCEIFKKFLECSPPQFFLINKCLGLLYFFVLNRSETISLHCTETGLVNAFQMLTAQFPETVGKTEVMPLAQVGLNIAQNN